MSDTSGPPSADGDGLLIRPRPPRRVRERLEQLADATGTTPVRIAVGAGLAVVALGVGSWLLRPAPAPPEIELPFASTTASTVPSSSTSAAAELVVHVAGAVVDPGVHELLPGARVIDAIEAAGGLRADADEARLNLAAPVVDGERVYVLSVGETSPPDAAGPPGPPPGASGTPAGPVNLNTADAAALDALPGVGPTTAGAIIKHREEVGGFTSVDELLDVSGIGEVKLEQLRPLVTV